MGTTDKKQEKNHKKNYRKICAIVGGIFITAMMVAGVSVVIAKYYAYQSSPGISVASAFYFNSNRLDKRIGAATKDAVRDMDTTGVPVSVNEGKWTTGTYQFPIEIRNYDSNLLFNETGLITEYEIYFRLIGTPKGATYQVSKKENGNEIEQTELKTANQMVGYTSVLSGGSLKSDEYQISITLNDINEYEGNPKAKVLVVAYPTSPDYLRNDTAQPFRLVGMFEGRITEGEMDIESAKFLVQDSEGYDSTTWEDKVNDLSGLIFNVKTKGDVAASDSNAAKQEAFVKWKSEYLQISKYDECYENAKKNKEGTGADKDTWLFEKTENGITWKYMKIEALPYTSVDITFYKTEKFIQEMNNNTMTKDKFQELASAYMEKETQSP